MAVSGSIPSKLVFLTDLPNLQDRDKVRILGCVDYYDARSGHLLLTHNYPLSAPEVTAVVDLSHVLENLQGTALQGGVWVNVVGYVMNGESTTNKATAKSGARDANASNIRVQAILIWEAVAIDIDEYEKAVQARKDLGTTG